MTFPKSIEQFPITNHLEEICSTLKNSESRSLVLTAQTGAGKSTVLPLALLQAFEGKIIITEPRRLAVLGVANRVSSLLEQQTGSDVGYRIHLETKISPKTRLEVVTEGILIRMLQSDPALENVNVVVLDEFHERSINTDLALAFLKEAMELRDDLFVIVMSATIDSKKIAAFLNKAPILEIPGRTFPVDIKYEPSKSIEVVINECLNKTTGNILVFLPGISEIRKIQNILRESLSNHNQIEICILHSSISIDEQKYVLSETLENSRRIILSTAIAETSLTVPGVTCVVDSGFSRVNRINLNTGMENLVTEKESEFSASQRAGRAGRIQAGICIRMWNQFDILNKELQPEILRTDINQLVLECADRGIYDLKTINLLDYPTEKSWITGVNLLQKLGCFSQNNRITERGKAALKLGIGPRLACIGIDGMEFHQNSLLKMNKFCAEILVKYSQYSQSSSKIKNQFLTNFEKKLCEILENSNKISEICLNSSNFVAEKNQNSANILLSGFPDRIAVRLSEAGIEQPVYQFPSGRKARIHNCKHTNSKWIIAPEVMSGQTEGIIFEFEEISDDLISQWMSDKIETKIECRFENGKIIKNENQCFGQLILSTKKLQSTAEDYAHAWMNEVKTKGIESLPFNDNISSFLLRLKFYIQQNPESQNLYSELSESPENWLLPFITSNSLSSDSVYQALVSAFYELKLDDKIPEQIILQNGNRAKVKYENLASPDDKLKLVIRPVIDIIIQRTFGCTITPKIAGMKVLFRLLSPAQRPLQITDDLENFWISTWPQICKEMKGRYPKHNWDVSKPQKDK